MNPNNPARLELESYLKQHGLPMRIEVLVCDCNAIFRGKWFPGADLEKLVTKGTNFPISLLFGDLTCETPAGLLQPPLAGDPDGMYEYVPGSLRPVPWREVPTAQVQLQLASSPQLDPRQLLQTYLGATDTGGFVALEGEFVLSRHATHLDGPQVYSHQALEEAEPFLKDLYKLADTQAIELTSVLPEYGDGQFEVNLRHRASALDAADEYMVAKRVTKAAAVLAVEGTKGQTASFMALPGSGLAGNGCHIHVSLSDNEGKNLLLDDQSMAMAANGILTTVGECLALLAPHANSYRRIDSGGDFNTASATWGDNHRGVMLRIPKSDAANRRVEFRLAGADVNPYLLTLYTLAALHHGLAVGEATAVPRAGEGEPSPKGLALPTRWLTAIDALDGSTFARQVFGDQFIDTYVRMKRLEESKFHALVTDADRNWASSVV